MATSPALRIALATVMLVALSGCTSDEDWAASGLGEPTAAEQTTTTAPPPEWLFAVQSDGETTFDPSTGQISMPTASVQAFTDRPYRDTKVTSPQTFVNLWQRTDPDSFRADPPNAVLTYWDESTGTAVPRTVVCEITGDVGYTTADRRLSMGLNILEPKGATLPTRMSRASLFVDNLDGPFLCPVSPDDEPNIEYFNMLTFMDEILVVVDDLPSSDAYEVTLQCPERESTAVPTASFDVQLATADNASTVSCYSGGTITLPKQGLSDRPYCRPSGNCGFVVTALNTQTEYRYSQTDIEVPVTASNEIIPDLEPATLPFCPSGGDPIDPLNAAPGEIELSDSPS